MQGVTICEQVERKICADDNCVLVEGDPQVIDQMFLNFMEQNYLDMNTIQFKLSSSCSILCQLLSSSKSVCVSVV